MVVIKKYMYLECGNVAIKALNFYMGGHSLPTYDWGIIIIIIIMCLEWLIHINKIIIIIITILFMWKNLKLFLIMKNNI